MTPEEGPGDPPPTSHLSSASAPENPSPTTPGITTTLRKGTEERYRGTRPVEIADDQYEFLTVVVPTVHTPMIGEVES